MLQLNFVQNPVAGVPLYQQLYRCLADQIRDGTIAAGTRLPGKRSMAAELGLSVNTVDTAYQLLAAEGFVDSRPRSGFVVQKNLNQFPGQSIPQPLPTHTQPPRYRFDLTTGQVDTGLFPARTWARLQKELLYSGEDFLSGGQSLGEWELRCQLADYLNSYRGVQCRPEQLVIGAGVEYLLGLLAGLLPTAVAAVEDPGYSRARMILENNHLPCRLLPVDEEGLSVTALRASDASLCYATPSHQFPTGVTMPVTRRGELLRWAAEAPGRYIVEDDYDSEFRLDSRPLPSLQGMAGSSGSVIYLSTCSRSLAPGIRIAYMVLPPQLLTAYHSRYGSYSCTVGRLEQQTLAHFLADGYFTRHLARMRNSYKHRRNALVTALRRQFPEGSLRLYGLHTGIHLLLQRTDGPEEAEMVFLARQAGIRLTGLSEYYRTPGAPCPRRTVVLGYGSLPESEAAPLALALKALWTN